MLNAAWLMGQVPLRKVRAWDLASMESARPCVQSTLPWMQPTRSIRPPCLHTSSAYLLRTCCGGSSSDDNNSSLDDVDRRTTWGGAALGGVANQGEGAALVPRGTSCSETPSSGEGLQEDPVRGFVINRAIRTPAEMLTSTRMWNTFRSEHVAEELKPCLSLCRAQSGAVELLSTRYTC